MQGYIIVITYYDPHERYYVRFDGYGNPTTTANVGQAQTFESRTVAARILGIYRNELKCKLCLNKPFSIEITTT